ncbi:MAG: hypothetical protein Ct9H300mP27_08260 [Chloroflexota bacterium]|nr:MAG: hypothetical protein Ct9H300mP27_08260 [Chloroflexota bacterium]
MGNVYYFSKGNFKKQRENLKELRDGRFVTKNTSVQFWQPNEMEEFDAIVIGSGVTGLYSLYRMREQGFSVRAFDDAQG